MFNFGGKKVAEHLYTPQWTFGDLRLCGISHHEPITTSLQPSGALPRSDSYGNPQQEIHCGIGGCRLKTPLRSIGQATWPKDKMIQELPTRSRPESTTSTNYLVDSPNNTDIRTRRFFLPQFFQAQPP